MRNKIITALIIISIILWSFILSIGILYLFDDYDYQRINAIEKRIETLENKLDFLID